ncbi:phosphorylase [Halovenus sp. WSH3]|uniref:Phosphorylase n=1 Tax=Halovenus carboxidivorans TaxID=2692199 RepID=A0A6B0T2Q9_9EURY|nr:phosphorylase [Halovenus carboxidivorans]MXR52275.1 phosphorylase [Halovenus carboxidivorans]
MATDLDVLVLPAFDNLGDLPAETTPWERAYDLDRQREIAGLSRPLRYTERGVGVVPTGVGKSRAAVTTAALLGSDLIDLGDGLVLSVGVAGAPPSLPVGSVVVSERVVDWDEKCRFDDGELAMNPYTEGRGCYTLDAALVSEITSLGREVDLDTPEQSTEEPRLRRGTNLCGDELWHGAAVAEQAEWLAEQYDASPYCVTEMEDAGTATALERFGRLDSYCAIRGVSNHDRPTGDRSARESFFAEGFEDGFGLGVENAAAVARAVVDDRLA